MDKILFDSHCHISDERFSDCRDELIAEIEGSPIRFAADVGSNLKTSLDCAGNAEKYGFCYATCGYHPSELFDLDGPEGKEIITRTLKLYEDNPKVVAIGEIGLDYHFDDAPSKEAQQYWFRYQLDEAIRLDAPVCIHSRDAEADTMTILKESGIFGKNRTSRFPARPDGSPDARVLLHCFSGSAETARQYVKLGATISLAGPVTFKNAHKAVEVARTVPLWSLLIETDCPYMAPVPMRGKTNKPTYVEYVARKIAEIKGISYEEAAMATLENACRFYGIQA